jgi:hypothetical protein
MHEVVGFLLLYENAAYRFFHGPFTLDTIAGWPTDGIQVGMIFWGEEYAPGKPHRTVMMGNDSYFYVPSTGVIGHSDESAGQIRQRYGNDALIWRGKWTTMVDYKVCEQVAMSCDELAKLDSAWLDARIAELRP